MAERPRKGFAPVLRPQVFVCEQCGGNIAPDSPTVNASLSFALEGQARIGLEHSVFCSYQCAFSRSVSLVGYNHKLALWKRLNTATPMPDMILRDSLKGADALGFSMLQPREVPETASEDCDHRQKLSRIVCAREEMAD